MLASDQSFRDVVLADSTDYLKKLVSVATFNQYAMDALLEIGVNVSSVDRFNKNCLDVCVTPEAATFLVPLVPISVARKACLNAIRYDRSDVLGVIVGKINIDPTLIEKAVSMNATKSLSLMLNTGKTVLPSELWRFARSRRAAEILIDYMCPLSTQAIHDINNLEVLEIAVNSFQATTLSLSNLQLMLDRGRYDLIAEWRDRIPDASFGMLCEIASKDDIDMLKLLFRKEFAIDIAKSACVHGGVRCIEWLLDHHENAISSTPLVMYACSYANLHTVQYLLSRGISPIVRHANGSCALHTLAISAGDAIGSYKPPRDYELLVELIVRESLDVINAKDERGQTPLILAVIESNWIVTQVLLESGADHTMLDNQNLSVIDYATRQDVLFELNRYLEQYTLLCRKILRVNSRLRRKLAIFTLYTIYVSLLIATEMTITLENAPIVHPKSEDWSDGPCKYLERLHRQYGESHGIVKIVLPVANRPCYNVWSGLNAKFRPKTQSLQMMNGVHRQERLFELQVRLKRFRAQCALPRASPEIDGKKVRLFQLDLAHKKVKDWSAIASSSFWLEKIICSKPGIYVTEPKRVASKLQEIAATYLTNDIPEVLEMKCDENDVKCCAVMPTVGQVFYKAFEGGAVHIGTVTSVTKGKVNVEFRELSQGSTYTVDETQILIANGATEQAARDFVLSQTSSENRLCEICLKLVDNKKDRFFTCTGCDVAIHHRCYAHPSPPQLDWFCPDCMSPDSDMLSKLAAYGYVDSKDQISLKQFTNRSPRFNGDVAKTEAFFRSVMQGSEKMDFEPLYGSDLDALDVSDYPDVATIERLRNDQAPVRWDLRVLPIHADSLLDCVYSRGEIISGVSRPWIYAGSPLSTFCWHAEDHYLYSLNYLHQGMPKIWYGVPGAYLDKLEAVMKAELPLLYKETRDLHHHLVTFLDPSIFIKNGIPVHRVEQHVGEMVVTFPKAYHAGFNSGFNIAEAVNVACEDWLPYAIQSDFNYSRDRRMSVISIDSVIWDLCNQGNVRQSLVPQLQSQLMRMSQYWDGIKQPRQPMTALTGHRRSCRIKEGSAAYPRCDVCKRLCFVVAVRSEAGQFYCHDHCTNQPGVAFENISQRSLKDRLAELSTKQPTIMKDHDTKEWKLEVISVLKNLAIPGASVAGLTKSGRAVKTPRRLEQEENVVKKRSKLSEPSSGAIEGLVTLKRRGMRELGLIEGHAVLKQIDAEIARISGAKQTKDRILRQASVSFHDFDLVWNMRGLVCSGDEMRTLAKIVFAKKVVCEEPGHKQMLRVYSDQSRGFLSIGEIRALSR